MFKEIIKDREFLQKTLCIAAPVTLQSALNMITNFIDTLMVGSLGETAIAGVGLANKVFFVYILLVFGICSGISILASQYWGNHDVPNIRRVLGIGLVIALSGAFLFTFSALMNPEGLMGLFTSESGIISAGTRYLQIVCISYPLIGIINTTVAALRATEVAKPAVVNSAVAIVVNVILNYILIFGKLGLPAMGVAGAAVATVAARAVEVICTLISIKRYRTALDCPLKETFSVNFSLLIQFFSTSLPVVLNEFLWGLGITLYSAVYGRMGETAAAAMTIANTYMDIEVIGFQGLSTATLVILGNELGAGRLGDAERHSRYFFRLAFLVSIVTSILTFLLIRPFTGLFTIEQETAETVRRVLRIFAVSIFARAQNNIILVGVLRSGGDTRMCALLDLSGVWLMGVPLAYLTGLVMKLPVYLVFAATELEELVKMLLGFQRCGKKVWVRNLAEELKNIETSDKNTGIRKKR